MGEVNTGRVAQLTDAWACGVGKFPNHAASGFSAVVVSDTVGRMCECTEAVIIVFEGHAGLQRWFVIHCVSVQGPLGGTSKQLWQFVEGHASIQALSRAVVE